MGRQASYIQNPLFSAGLELNAVLTSDECRVISFDFQEFIDTFRETIWEILLPVLVFGGIYSGFLAVSEAAVVTVVYVLLVALLIITYVPGLSLLFVR